MLEFCHIKYFFVRPFDFDVYLPFVSSSFQFLITYACVLEYLGTSSLIKFRYFTRFKNIKLHAFLNKIVDTFAVQVLSL